MRTGCVRLFSWDWAEGRVLHSSVQFISEELASWTTSGAQNLYEADAAASWLRGVSVGRGQGWSN